jgi:TolB-like protein
VKRAVLLLSACLLTACSVATIDQWTRPGAVPVARLAVLPFDNQTAAVRAGSILADVLASELLATGAMPVADPGEVADLLRRESLDPIDVARWPAPSRLGRLLQVSHVMQGAVTEYRYKPGLSETPVVGVTARVVEVASGDVVWTATHAASGAWSRPSPATWRRTSPRACAGRARRGDVAAVRRRLPPRGGRRDRRPRGAEPHGVSA